MTKQHMEKDTTRRNAELLREYAHVHYEEGGHYMVETWEDEDFIAWLKRFPFLSQARRELRNHWQHLQKVAREIENA